MDGLILMSLAIASGCIYGVGFLVYKITQEEREKREEESFVRIHYRHLNKDGYCSECGLFHRECNCGY